MLASPSFTSPESPNRPGLATTHCAHCGLPVPAGLIQKDAQHQFCCMGCETAWAIIHEHGLQAWYRMKQSQPRDDNHELGNRGPEYGHQRFGEFDRPAFLQKFSLPVGDSVREVTFLLSGIHCAACIWLIEKLPRIVPGVLSVCVHWTKHTVRIRWDQGKVSLSRIARTLQQLGYTPSPASEGLRQAHRIRENRRFLVQIGIAAAAAGNNMLIAAALYLGMFSAMSGSMEQFLRMASCGIGLVSLCGPGRAFLNGAWSAVRTKTPHMDLPIALALVVGTTAGVVNTVRGTGEIWFDSLSVLVFLLLVGRWVQFRQQIRSADAVEMLYRLTPRVTRKVVNGEPVEISVDLVEADDLLEIRPGELMPVDAEVMQGQTLVDESILTGESRPKRCQAGDPVFAGTRNVSEVVLVSARATGSETRVARIMKLVEQASLDRPPVVQWANRVGGYFVVSVVILAVITFFAWSQTNISSATDHTIALLIVSCPCALALATPLAISVSLARAARQKTMIKSGDVFQLLEQPGMLWLDKTGTLTTGELQVVDWHGDIAWQSVIAAAEQRSSHPVARAIVSQYGVFGPDASESMGVYDVIEVPGAGIEARVAGDRIVAGSRGLLEKHGIAIDAKWQTVAESICARGLSPCFLGVNQSVVAILAIGDSIRPDTHFALECLKKRGWEVGILSGDHPQIVAQIAQRLGIDRTLARGELKPEDKLSQIRDSLNSFQTVVMVGDGVNDCAALAAASVGISVENGAEASLETAPVYLARPGLTPLLNLLDISRSTRNIIRAILALSIVYNLSGATLAATGWITPLVAAVLMPVSSLTALAISLTAGRIRKSGDNR